MSEYDSKEILETAEDRGARFMKLYTHIQRRLYGYVVTLVPESSDVDDIIQATVAVMWKNFDHFEPGTDFAAWALCIAKNQIYNYIQRKKNKKKVFSLKTLQEIEVTAEQKARDVDRRLDVLRRCIEKLSSRDRQLLTLRYEVGATLKNVSERVEQSVNTLYSRLYKIRIALLCCVQKTMRREDTLA